MAVLRPQDRGLAAIALTLLPRIAKAADCTHERGREVPLVAANSEIYGRSWPPFGHVAGCTGHDPCFGCRRLASLAVICRSRPQWPRCVAAPATDDAIQQLLASSRATPVSDLPFCLDRHAGHETLNSRLPTYLQIPPSLYHPKRTPQYPIRYTWLEFPAPAYVARSYSWWHCSSGNREWSTYRRQGRPAKQVEIVLKASLAFFRTAAKRAESASTSLLPGRLTVHAPAPSDLFRGRPCHTCSAPTLPSPLYLLLSTATNSLAAIHS